MSRRSISAVAAALASLLAWSGAAAAAPAEPIAAEVHPARQFGYRIGDEIRLDVRITPPRGYAFDAETAPMPGRVGAFLELRRIEPHAAAFAGFGGERTQHFTVRFLVVNSDPGVRVTTTPALNLSFRRRGAPPFDVALPEVTFALSPLIPDYADAALAPDGLRVDLPAPQVSTRGPQLRLLTYLSIAVSGLVVLAWRQGWLPRRLLARRPFAQAAIEISRLGHSATPGVQALRARRLHHAFDQAAGFAVAAHTLDRFLGAQPRFVRLEPQIRDFFSASARFFYADQAAALDDPAHLRRLARALAECEARQGAAP
jgi:mxaA protein